MPDVTVSQIKSCFKSHTKRPFFTRITEPFDHKAINMAQVYLKPLPETKILTTKELYNLFLYFLGTPPLEPDTAAYTFFTMLVPMVFVKFTAENFLDLMCKLRTNNINLISEQDFSRLIELTSAPNFSIKDYDYKTFVAGIIESGKNEKPKIIVHN